MGLYFAMFLIAVSFAAPVICDQQNQTTIKEWCAKTYNPKPCEDLLTNDPKYAPVEINGKDDLINVSLLLAYDRAINASKAAHQLGPKCENQSEKAAWLNCVDLFDKNVAILNQTIHQDYICNSTDTESMGLDELNQKRDDSPTNCTAFHMLSATLDNIDSCEDGFLDINVTDNVFPLVQDKVLEDLIVNALALVSEMQGGRNN